MVRTDVPPPSEVRMPVTSAPCCLKKPFASATAKGMPLVVTP